MSTMRPWTCCGAPRPRARPRCWSRWTHPCPVSGCTPATGMTIPPRITPKTVLDASTARSGGSLSDDGLAEVRVALGASAPW
ncbi:hypothetical protein QJS66_03085 [Kocuria rhizophila]|nr:hypothetical protein QJS66_03085 [Kocuria rhizophila]